VHGRAGCIPGSLNPSVTCAKSSAGAGGRPCRHHRLRCDGCISNTHHTIAASGKRRWSYSQGEQLSQAGRFANAIERFRSAYNQNPTNPAYQLALIAALRRAGEVDQAKLTVTRLLEKAPADGAANIEMARILAQSNNWRNAAWYYHRGLYGQWRNPIDLVLLRFELADLLASHHANEDLLAELPLLDREVTDPSDQRHLGKLLIEAKSWTRAEQVYQALLRKSGCDAELWAGLGQSQLGRGDYRASQHSFDHASTCAPTASSSSK
jgi:Flp pilus assembly protein TadD